MSNINFYSYNEDLVPACFCIANLLHTRMQRYISYSKHRCVCVCACVCAGSHRK